MNSFSIRFRVAKTTPTKIGQFVTRWQRSEDGSTQPYDGSDPADMYVISTRSGSHFGQFVFPKHVLLQRDIVSIKAKVASAPYVYIRPGTSQQVNRL
ncbi:MepB family protein [Paenibacillus sp. FSL k6-2145]|uniref:MepB family protein n=1 Tax=Paenibacillus sp. FSL k6-2145 TaxID=2976834 RepID=UPI001F108D01|nr:MepB family protein [Paenibacillus amylolyticus]